MIRKGRSGKEKKKFAHFGSPDGDAVMELIAFLIGACGLTLLILSIDGIRLNRWPVLLAAPIPAALVWFLGKAGGLNRRIWIAAGAALLAVLLSIPRIFPPLQEQFQAILSAVLGGGEGEEVTAAAALLAMESSLVLFLLKVGLRLRWPLYVFLSILLLASSSLGISPGTAAACLLFLCSAAAARRLGTGIDRLYPFVFAAGALLIALLLTWKNEEIFFQAVFRAEGALQRTAKRMGGVDFRESEGSVNRGNLYPAGTEELEVQVDIMPEEALYLKGFTGGVYSGGEWEPDREEDVFARMEENSLHWERWSDWIPGMFDTMYFVMNSNMRGEDGTKARSLWIRQRETVGQQWYVSYFASLNRANMQRLDPSEQEYGFQY